MINPFPAWASVYFPNLPMPDAHRQATRKATGVRSPPGRKQSLSLRCRADSLPAIEASVGDVLAIRRGSDVGIHIARDDLRTASQSRGAVNVKLILRGAARFPE